MQPGWASSDGVDFVWSATHRIGIAGSDTSRVQLWQLWNPLVFGGDWLSSIPERASTIEAAWISGVRLADHIDNLAWFSSMFDYLTIQISVFCSPISLCQAGHSSDDAGLQLGPRSVVSEEDLKSCAMLCHIGGESGGVFVPVNADFGSSGSEAVVARSTMSRLATKSLDEIWWDDMNDANWIKSEPSSIFTKEKEGENKHYKSAWGFEDLFSSPKKDKLAPQICAAKGAAKAWVDPDSPKGKGKGRKAWIAIAELKFDSEIHWIHWLCWNARVKGTSNCIFPLEISWVRARMFGMCPLFWLRARVLESGRVAEATAVGVDSRLLHPDCEVREAKMAKEQKGNVHRHA